jgi:hypothetical protein
LTLAKPAFIIPLLGFFPASLQVRNPSSHLQMSRQTKGNVMPKALIPLHIADLSDFTKQLRAALLARTTNEPISHLTLMNVVAKAAGHRNVQVLRAQTALFVPTPQLAPAAADIKAKLKQEQLVERTLRVFDERARMTRWPTARPTQRLCTWFMWSRFERARVYTEKEVNAVLKEFDAYQGYVVMRRELINDGLFTRERDGSKYQRVEQRPPEEALRVIRALSVRQFAP